MIQRFFFLFHFHNKNVAFKIVKKKEINLKYLQQKEAKKKLFQYNGCYFIE